MNDRITPPKDYVVRPVRQHTARLDEKKSRRRVIGDAIAVALGVIALVAFVTWMIDNAARADAAVADYPGPVCAMTSPTAGFCPH